MPRGVYGVARASLNTATASPAIAAAPVTSDNVKVVAGIAISALVLASAAKVYKAVSHEMLVTHRRTRKW